MKKESKFKFFSGVVVNTDKVEAVVPRSDPHENLKYYDVWYEIHLSNGTMLSTEPYVQSEEQAAKYLQQNAIDAFVGKEK